MTWNALRMWSMKLGGISATVGVALLAGGFLLASVPILGAGVLVIGTGAYAMTFGYLGSF